MDAEVECRPGREYDEAAFLYFLRAELARADRSGHALRLLLVSVERCPGKPAPIGRATAARLFERLRLSLRETDVLGWYRQDRVAGAVVRAPAGATAPRDSREIHERVGEGLRCGLPSATAGSLRLRVIQLRRPFAWIEP